MNAKLPTWTSWPPTLPTTPEPVTASKACAASISRPFAKASATMAAATGCSLERSRLAARRRTSASEKVPVARTSVTFGLPSVNVPVLSMTRVSTRASSSSASARRTSTPCRHHAGRNHHRDRRRKSERARARDNEHRDGRHDCIGERGFRPQQHPTEKCEQRDADDGGNEVARDAVCKTLDWRAAALRLGDHRDDLGERGVGANLLCLHHETARAVERAAGNSVARTLVDRQRLAGEQLLVDG